ncbi:hypothetical protein, partial [Pseudoalteromonas luteoviolacea]|uniref:hypothetical protein n=1 Tax=Pseudoalteromonas luteoviolacea TaxID=43657 RepID=UPI001E2B45EA
RILNALALLINTGLVCLMISQSAIFKSTNVLSHQGSFMSLYHSLRQQVNTRYQRKGQAQSW